MPPGSVQFTAHFTVRQSPIYDCRGRREISLFKGPKQK